MLSNRYISEIMPEELWERYAEMETDMIVALARLSLTYDQATREELRRAIDELTREIDGIVQANWQGTQKDLAQAITEAGSKSLSADEKIYMAGVSAGLVAAAAPINQSLALKHIMRTGYNVGINKLGMVNTTAVNTTISMLNEAFLMSFNGRMTLREAIRFAADDMAARGIVAAIFPSGRSMEMGPYVRMVTKTTVMNTTNELVKQRADEYGVDLLQISSHAGARPRCAPFQGQIFSRSGTHKSFAALSSTSYGEAAGLFGINCGHYGYPFIEGLDRLPEPEELDPAKYGLDKENGQVYAESQQQRYLERKIREWKRRAEASDAAGVSSLKARQKIRYWQARQRAFIGQTDRTRRYDREAA